MNRGNSLKLAEASSIGSLMLGDLIKGVKAEAKAVEVTGPCGKNSRLGV